MKDFKRIIAFSKSLWRLYLIVGLLTITFAGLSQVTPFLTKAIVDTIVKNFSVQKVPVRPLVNFTVLILLAQIAMTLVNNVMGYVGDQISVKLNRLLSESYLAHLLNLPQAYFDNELTGRIINRLNRSITEITNFAQGFINNFLRMIVTAVFTLGIIAYYSWPVALFLAVLFPIYFWLTKRSSSIWKKKQAKIIGHTEYAHGRFAEVVGQIRVVKSFGQERTERKVFKQEFDRIEGTVRKQSRTWHLYDVYRNLAMSVVMFLAYGYITYQLFQHSITLGVFTLLIQLILQMQQPLFLSSFLVDNLQRAEANSKDFFDVMAIEPAIKDQDGAQPLSVTKGKIEFQNVSFAYTKGVPVLHGISFEVHPGSKLALIGESGEGKSTIANLLLRLYEPTAGQILIDSQDVNSVTQLSLRQNIAMVFQDASLFSGTVEENISYGKPSASQGEIVAAAKAANAHSFIQALPKAYATEIGERGVKLSGGQKQRVAIARALLKDAPLLILDEATSSLDSKAEAEVQKALERLMHGRTTIIIAHRLSTIKDVDAIVSLKKGQVAEVGSPGELAGSEGIYAQLLALQNPTAANKMRLRNYELVAR